MVFMTEQACLLQRTPEWVWLLMSVRPMALKKIAQNHRANSNLNFLIQPQNPMALPFVRIVSTRRFE